MAEGSRHGRGAWRCIPSLVDGRGGLMADPSQPEAVLDQPVEVELAHHAVVRPGRAFDVLDQVAPTMVPLDVVRPDAERRGVQDRVVVDGVDELDGR